MVMAVTAAEDRPKTITPLATGVTERPVGALYVHNSRDITSRARPPISHGRDHLVSRAANKKSTPLLLLSSFIVILC